MSKPKRAEIRVRGARQNNLKNLDLDLPLNHLIVVTGLSGSGKSSLAFDTLYAEGQRRYIETFSPYARQFLDRMDKPQVDSIEGIPPAIAVEQRNAVRTTRSTVGTMTEVCDYMKLLWPQLSRCYCRQCGAHVQKEPPQTVWSAVREDCGAQTSAEVLVTFDLGLSEKLSLNETLALIAKQGYQRLVIEDQIVRLEDHQSDAGSLPAPSGSLTVVQDRVRLVAANRSRFIEACEQAYHFGKGALEVRMVTTEGGLAKRRRFSNRNHCAPCNLDYREPVPALFSFNHPLGACPSCRGFGRVIGIDYNLAVPDRRKTLKAGVVRPWQTGQGLECQQDLLRICRQKGIPINVPFQELDPRWQDFVLNGEPDYGKDAAHQWPKAWYGVKGYFRWLEGRAYKMHVRVLLSRYRAYTSCPECQGRRFQPESLCYQVSHPAAPQESRFTLADFYQLPIRQALPVLEALASTARLSSGLDLAMKEVLARLRYLQEVGLGHLTLDRPTRTLSGGETERVNLTTCLGTRLVNTLYVLDEPTVGLHPRDTNRLVSILQKLRDAGNTVLVVEHEALLMRAADLILDLGPGHGATGGQLVFQGSYREILRSARSITGAYLNGRRKVEHPAEPNGDAEAPPADGGTLRIRNATRHNLRKLEVELPLNKLVCVTGVSGSGKTTLVREVLLPSLQAALGDGVPRSKASEMVEADGSQDGPQPEESTGPAFATVEGWQSLTGVVWVDQSALGKTPRSNPAVYVGAFEFIRTVFAETDMARQRGLGTSAFSFNSREGQCERCRGAGFEKIEMQFLSDVYVRCPDCNGRRYRSHILEVRLPCSSPKAEARAASIADLLEMTVDEAVGRLEGLAGSRAASKAAAQLKWLQQVGLGYLALGQPINTLSGGESQRLKLVRHLAQSNASPNASPATQKLLFLFDEPTTGLHFEDVRVLLGAFRQLIAAGHSVLVVEHNIDLIRNADWIVDLGPEAGEFGGKLVIAGTPATVAACKASHTGQAIRQTIVSRRIGRD